MKPVTLLLTALLCLGCVYEYQRADARTAPAYEKNNKHGDKEKGRHKDKKAGHKSDKKSMVDRPATSADAASGVTVLKRWEMPAQLREISGIARVDAERFACIQDEAGTIFIYNTSRQAIEEEIGFAGPGDYEDIALAGTMAYVLRSDGLLYEVADYRTGKPAVHTYHTGFTIKQNMEGLCYDAAHKRLLLSVKGRDANSDAYKGIYAFDLASHRTLPAPIYRLNLNDPLLQAGQGNRKHSGSQPMPSAIARHPQGDALYILDGVAGKLLVVAPDGSLKAVWNLGGQFPQAEGLVISPKGELFIASEGVKGAGILAQVVLDGGSSSE